MTAEADVISGLLQSSPLSWPPTINLILLLAARLAAMQLQNKAVSSAGEGNPDLAILKWLCSTLTHKSLRGFGKISPMSK